MLDLMKIGQVLLQKWEVFLHYEAVQVVLQSKVGMQIRIVFITNLGVILQSGETIIRKWSRYYKIEKLFQSRWCKRRRVAAGVFNK